MTQNCRRQGFVIGNLFSGWLTGALLVSACTPGATPTVGSTPAPPATTATLPAPTVIVRTPSTARPTTTPTATATQTADATTIAAGWSVQLSGASASALLNTSWTLTQLSGGPMTLDQAGDILSVDPRQQGVRVTLVISADRIFGDTGCNRFDSPYTAAGDHLMVGDPVTTLLPCSEPGASIEARYLDAFRSAREWRVGQQTLEFRDAAGLLSATFVAEVQAAATFTPEPTLPATQIVTPTITAFTVAPLTAERGQPLTLNWSTTDALSVTLQHRDPNSWWGTEIPGSYPLSGEVVITDTVKDEGITTFILTAYGAGGGWAQQEVAVKFPCLNAYFFTSQELSQCPLGPARTATIVLQPFEHGWMVWIGYDSGGTVTVLYDGGRIATYPDAWTEAQPVNDPTLTPPPDLLQPVRGFGLVWRTQTGVRDGLGWATLAEGPYETQIQNRSTGGDWKAINYYFRLWDGRIVHVTGRTMPGQWEFVSP